MLLPDKGRVPSSVTFATTVIPYQDKPKTCFLNELNQTQFWSFRHSFCLQLSSRENCTSGTRQHLFRGRMAFRPSCMLRNNSVIISFWEIPHTLPPNLPCNFHFAGGRGLETIDYAAGRFQSSPGSLCLRFSLGKTPGRACKLSLPSWSGRCAAFSRRPRERAPSRCRRPSPRRKDALRSGCRAAKCGRGRPRCTPMSTNAPKSTTFRTVPVSSMPGFRSSNLHHVGAQHRLRQSRRAGRAPGAAAPKQCR